jgi:hypothetical protein
MFSIAEAAVFNVTNVTQLQDALTAAQSNRQDDTITLLREPISSVRG